MPLAKKRDSLSYVIAEIYSLELEGSNFRSTRLQTKSSSCTQPGSQNWYLPSPTLHYRELFEVVGLLIFTTLGLTYCISNLCVSTMLWGASLSSAYL